MNIEQKFDALALTSGILPSLLAEGETPGQHLIELVMGGSAMDEPTLTGTLYRMNMGPVGKIYFGDLDKGWFFCTQNNTAYGPLLCDDGAYREGLTTNYLRIGYLGADGLFHNTAPPMPSGSVPFWWDGTQGKHIAINETPLTVTPKPDAPLPSGPGLFHTDDVNGGSLHPVPQVGPTVSIFMNQEQVDAWYAAHPGVLRA